MGNWLAAPKTMHARLLCIRRVFSFVFNSFFLRARSSGNFIHSLYFFFTVVRTWHTVDITYDDGFYYIWLLLLQCCCLWGFSVILSATLRALRAHKQYCAMTLSRMALRKLCLLDFWANDLSWQQLCGSITAFLIWEYGTIEIASCNSDCMLSPIFIERKYRSVK